MSFPSSEQFAATVERRMRPDFRYDNPTIETFSTYHEENAKQDSTAPLDRPGFRMRLEGGYIVECVLRDSRNELTEVLYTPPNLAVAKLDASHVMSPVGPHNGLGGQHGFARWSDYTISHIERPPASVIVTANTPLDTPTIERSAEVVDDRVLSVTSVLHSLMPESMHSSLGEHFYLPLAGGNANGLRIGATEAELAEPSKLAEIMEGKAQFWSDFGGSAVVDFPDGKRIQIDARAYSRADRVDTPLAVGMLLWHRPGTESICIEPTVGYAQDDQGVMRNDLAEIAARGALALETNIRLLS